MNGDATISKEQRKRILRLLRHYNINYDALSDWLFIERCTPCLRNVLATECEVVIAWIRSHSRGG